MATPTSTTHPHANYWQGRIDAVLAQLGYEARRVFQLEQDLSDFSQQYYARVGGVAERLAQIEQKMATALAENHAAPIQNITAPHIETHYNAAAARREELKTRYRGLAKEIHPDRAMVVEGNGARARHMHSLNAAYRQQDLAALLVLEAQILLLGMLEAGDMAALERGIYEVERAAETYADSYRTLLHSPLNELMLRAMSARLAGWDWMEAVVQKVERSIEEKERAVVRASIAQISAWREALKAA